MNRFARVLRRLSSVMVILLPLSALAAAPACPTIGVGPTSLPDGVVGSAYTQTLSATTGNPPSAFAPAAYGVDSGVLPTGLAINAGQLVGTPTSTGAFDFAISASDAASCSGSRIYRVSVVCGSFTIAPPTHAVVGTAYNQTLVASGGAAPYTFALDTASPLLPTGLTLASDGTLSGTAQAGSGGSYALQIDVSDASSCSNAAVAVTLIVDESPAFTSVNSTTFTVGSAGSFLVTATGYPAPTLSTGSALPGGVTFDPLSGVLAGTPAAGSAGTYPVTFSATNSLGTTTQNFTLTVTDAPTFTSANAATFTVGTSGTFTVTASGSPTPALTLTSGALPGGVTFTQATGVLAGTATAGSGGVYNLVFSASNGVGAPVTQNFTLTVNEAPTITSANTIAFALNAPSTFTVTATGYPLPTFSETGALPNGINLSTSGVLSGTPTTSGSYPITLTASNGIGVAATQAFTLAVTDPPVFTSANAATFTVGTSGTFTVTASGSPTPALTLTSGALPGGVTFTQATGVLAGTATAGSGGVYNLVFSASNGVGAPVTQNFTLTVNEAPTITSANTIAFALNAPSTFTVTATGYPLPTFSETGALPNGITLSTAGVLSGTPTTSGSYPIMLSASNGIGVAATQAFTLAVTEPPAFTSASAVTFTVGVAGSFTVTANGSPTPMLGMSGSLPSGVSFNAVTGVLSGTPVAGSGGSYPLVFTASNGVGADAMQNFTLTVNQAPVISSAASATFPIGTPNSFTVTSSGFPTPAVSETGALPGGITFVDNGDGTAALAGTPQPGSAGTWPLSIKAANGVASDALQSFTLTVSCPVITVSGTLPDGLYQTAYGAQTFTQTGSAGAPVWTATGLPAGLVIGAADGIVSGSPTTTTNGVTVAVTATDANQCTGTLAINNFKVLPVAGNDAYATFGNTQLYVATATPATPYVGSATLITANDAGPAPIVAAILAAPAHGTLTSFVGGGFIFTPTAGYSGNDSFTYTITDGNGVMSSPATVAISLGQVVWYVNGAAGAGDGRSATPFNSLVAASAAHAAGDAIFVESAVAPTTTPGAITLKANTTLWGQGVALPLAISNTGATSKPKLTGTVTLGGNGVTISSLDINTAATIGLTNAGSLTGAIVKNDVTIATTSAAALSLSNVTASTLTFRRIDAGTAATGPVNGIVLNKTSALTVLGDGTTSTCNSGNTACSGGIIQHTSGDAISLTAAGATLSSMWIKNNVNSGIKGQGVPKLVLADLLVQNNTNNTGEQAGILINELSDPAATATRIEVSGSTEDNVRIHNSSVAGAIVIDASTVIDNSAASGNQGVFFQTNTTGNLTGTVKNSFLHGNRTIALRGDAGDGSTLSATFTGNTITAGVVNQGNQGIEVTRAVTSALTFNVANNAVSGLPSTLINVFSSGGPGTATGDVKNNTVSGVGVGGNQVGIRLFNSGSDLAGYATMNVNVANNTVSAIDNAYAILGESSQPGTSVNPGGALKIAVTGNTANVAAGGTALDAIRVQSRVKSTVCARISGNTSGGGGGGFYGLQLRQANTALYNLEGLTAGPQTDPTVFNYVVAQNPAVATVGPTIGTITGVATNSCGITP